jgi:predicted transcriptional regulator
MSESSESSTGNQIRTLAVRITEDLRARLDVVAQITGRSTTDEIRVALEHWVEKTKSDPAILQKAAAIRAEIEREAQMRRNAISAIFGAEAPAEEKTEESTPAGRPAARRGKTSDE